MIKEHLKINISDLKINEKNPKQHDDEIIKKSIEKLGFVDDIVIDESNMILAGHGRLKALQDLNITEIDVIRVSGWTQAEKDQYLLLSNKSVELGGWDFKKLSAFDKDIVQESGFGDQLDQIFKPDDSEKDDDVPEIPIEPKSKLGEIYQLGPHRIMCGDSTDKEDVAKLMGDKKADMVFTDPPYNVDYHGRGKDTSEGIENDNMSSEKFNEFLQKTFEAYKLAVKISAPFYICHSSSSQIIFEEQMAKTDLRVKNQIIWNKSVASMGWGDYRWKHEPIFYATYGKKNVQFYGDRSQYTVWNESWDIKKIEKHLKNIAKKQERGGSTIWTISRESNYKHPTQKPVELIGLALLNSSKQEDLVLDLFLGSGATLIACQKLNRACYGMELDPKYIDVIIERWEDYTGQKAEKLTDHSPTP